MTPFDFWPWTARLPLGGDVAQAIAPLTNLFSPTVELNFAGNRRIEGDVVSNVASYGKQLGILTDAVLALGGDDRSDAVQRLRDLAERIEARKLQYKDDVRQQAKTALEALIKADPGALRALLDEFAGRSGKPT